MPISEAFRTGPISRFRATLAIVFAGAAVLAAGGMLEYASGSPAAGTTQSTTFWAVFFGLNLVAFGGAALLGALPPLTQPLVKLAWGLRFSCSTSSSSGSGRASIPEVSSPPRRRGWVAGRFTCPPRWR